jgi:hypothetical protein
MSIHASFAIKARYLESVYYNSILQDLIKMRGIWSVRGKPKVHDHFDDAKQFNVFWLIQVQSTLFQS